MSFLQCSGEEPHHPYLLQHSEAGQPLPPKRGPHLGYKDWRAGRGFGRVVGRGVGSGKNLVDRVVDCVVDGRVLGMMVTVLCGRVELVDTVTCVVAVILEVTSSDETDDCGVEVGDDDSASDEEAGTDELDAGVDEGDDESVVEESATDELDWAVDVSSPVRVLVSQYSSNLLSISATSGYAWSSAKPGRITSRTSSRSVLEYGLARNLSSIGSAS